MGVNLEDSTKDVGLERGLKGIGESWTGENDGQWPLVAFCNLFIILHPFSNQLKIPGSGHLPQRVEHFILKKSFSQLLPV